MDRGSKWKLAVSTAAIILFLFTKGGRREINVSTAGLYSTYGDFDLEV